MDNSDLASLADIDHTQADIFLRHRAYNRREAAHHLVWVIELFRDFAMPTEDDFGIIADVRCHRVLKDIEDINAVSGKPYYPYPTTSACGKYTIESESHKRCVIELAVSSWDPPPSALKQAGHLLYLTAQTLEDERIEIVGSSSGFFVSGSTATLFDPTCRSECMHKTLVQLLIAESPKFIDAYKKILQPPSETELLIMTPVSNCKPTYPWTTTKPKHKRSTFRTQSNYLRASGTDDSMRDWNDEIQSNRELPFDAIQDRIFREKLLSRSLSEFIECATKAVIYVKDGDVYPLNPTEPPEAHLYIYNNVFISRSVDTIDIFSDLGGDEAARVAATKDLLGAQYISGLLQDSSISLFTIGTVIVDYLGQRYAAQSILPGIFRSPPAGEEGNHHQVVYGAMDDREQIFADPEVEKSLLQLKARGLVMKKHPVLDIDGNKTEILTNSEVKCLKGTDGRNYLLDLFRLFPVDIEFLENSWETGDDQYPHKMVFIRPEAIQIHLRAKAMEWLQKKKESKNLTDNAQQDYESRETEAHTVQPADFRDYEYSLNVEAFCMKDTSTLTSEELDKLKKDENDVRDVSLYLREKIIPSLIKDLENGVTAIPLDSIGLKTLLHSKGINLRYLGRVTSLAAKHEARLNEFVVACMHEMAARALKHLANSILRTSNKQPSFVLAALINHFFGAVSEDASELRIEPDQIAHEVHRRFRYTLPVEWFSCKMRPLSFLRNVALKLGLQLLDGCGNFTNEPLNQTRPQPINGSDILNIYPLVRSTKFRSSLAEEALEAATRSIVQNQKDMGLDLLREARALFEQIYGVVHPETANAYSRMASIYNQLDDHENSCRLARLSAIVAERVIGRDHHDTLLSILNWSLFEHSAGNSAVAFRLSRYALHSWLVTFGPGHRDQITTVVSNVSCCLIL